MITPSPCSLRQLPPSKAVSSDTCACNQGCHAPAAVHAPALPGCCSCQASAPAAPAWEACWRSGCTPCRDMLNQGLGLRSLPCSAGGDLGCSAASAAGSAAVRMAACLDLSRRQDALKGHSRHQATARLSASQRQSNFLETSQAAQNLDSGAGQDLGFF